MISQRHVVVALAGLGLLAGSPLEAAPPQSKKTGQGIGRGHGDAHGGGKQALGHRFRDAARWAKRFESKERAKWQRPDAVVRALKLTKAMKVADLGSATGYFAVRLARAVPEGRVYGVDIEPDMVRYLNQRAKKARLQNLSSHVGKVDDPKLPEAVDLVFICDTYHHIPGRTGYFRRLRKKLRPNGRLVIVDFKLGKIPVGPAEHHRISPARLQRELAAAGYQRVRLDTKTLPYQYIAHYRAASR